MSNIYMKIPNIQGSTTEKTHSGWIELKSMDFGTHRNISVQPGSVSDRENYILRISDFSVTKILDQSSPELFEASCVGASNGTVIIQACRTSPNGFDDYLQYTLSDAIISHYDINGFSSDSESDEPVETVRLNFTKIEMKYVPRDSSNRSGSPVICGYDIEKATKL